MVVAALWGTAHLLQEHQYPPHGMECDWRAACRRSLCVPSWACAVAHAVLAAGDELSATVTIFQTLTGPTSSSFTLTPRGCIEAQGRERVHFVGFQPSPTLLRELGAVLYIVSAPVPSSPHLTSPFSAGWTRRTRRAWSLYPCSSRTASTLAAVPASMYPTSHATQHHLVLHLMSVENEYQPNLVLDSFDGNLKILLCC